MANVLGLLNGRYTGPVEKRIKERCAERLLAERGLQHGEAQAALAATFSVTAMESPSARLDEASLALFGAARLEVHEQAHALAVGSASISGRPDATEVQRRCPHQVAHSVLRAIGGAAPPDAAKRAERLLRSVPVRGC
jgi:hypothetical protein